MFAHSLTGEVGIRSRSHDLVGKVSRILRMSSSETGLKEDMLVLLVLGLVTETGNDDCSAALILTILSLKTMSKLRYLLYQ